MIFGDYAPPTSPSLPEQRDALRKGLGRSVRWATAGVLDEGSLLAACLEDQRFEKSVEGYRGDWLWQMVHATRAVERFRVPILHALYELAEPDNADQLCILARCYAAAGDETFRARLYEIVNQNPFAEDCPCLGEEEIVAIDAAAGFLFAARVRGRALSEREWDWSDGNLVSYAGERLGEDYLKSIPEASPGSEVRRFLDVWRAQLELRPGNRSGEGWRAKQLAVSADDVIRAAYGEASCSWFRTWGRAVDESRLQTVWNTLRTAGSPQMITNLLQVFLARPLPEFDPYLIEMCRHADENVRWRAYQALEENAHPLVREFALAEAGNRIKGSNVCDLFINNYRPGDDEFILDAIVLPDDPNELHWLMMSARKFLAKNLGADGSRLGVMAYALTPCATCRTSTTELLIERNAAPDWLREECRFDCEEEFWLSA